MTRLLIGFSILLFSALARAGDCYYYWTHQCVEVLDASKRQLRQSVLISPSVNYFNSGAESCDASASNREQNSLPQLLEAFNAHAARIRACNAPLEQVSLKVFDDPRKATWYFNRTTRSTDSKTVIMVDNLPLL